MKGDFSRNSFDPTKHYRGVRMQQGRVQIDADWNEQIDMTDYRDRLFTEDFLGDGVGPSTGAGFAIGVTANQQDLTIGLGRYYVNGLLIENSSSLYFTQQADYPQAALPTIDSVYLTYLEVWQRSLGMADDADMAESALGGVDTATRLYTVAQVKLLPADKTNITNLTYNTLFNANAPIDSAAYNNAQHWNALINRLPSNVNTVQLLPDVGTMTSKTNATYRVQIHQGGGASQATYKTSNDNPLVQINVSTIQGNIITLANQPANEPVFAVGQWLELTTPTRDAARLPGDMVQITDADGLALTVSGQFGTDIIVTNAARARRWQINATGFAHSVPLESGLTIHFLGNTFQTGSYWTITTNATKHTVNWPIHNGQLVALPPNSSTIGQLKPIVSNSILQNQLYRVEIHQSGTAGQASFKWSRDNACVSSKITWISSNNITLTTMPEDGINGFMLNQWLELTTPARELIGTPGDMVQITAINDTMLTVTGSIGSDITIANNAIARRWDTAVNGNAKAVNIIDTSKLLPIENGLSISFSGNDFQTGDYWLIPARAATNSQGSHIDWPLDTNSNFLIQLPEGIQRSYAPLAIVQLSGGKWIFQSDARTLATPLSELDIKVIGADPCAPADTIHVDCNGQVGISTDTPTAKLDVETNAGLVTQNAIRAVANNGVAITAITKDNKAAALQNASTQPTLQLNNSGSGYGINTRSVEGRAGFFTNSSSTNATLYVNNTGDCLAGQFYNNSATHPTLYAENHSDYMAAEFVNSSTTHPTLFISNDGDATGIQAAAKTGHAASFTNNSTTNATLLAINNGSSHGIYAAASEGRAASFTNNSATNATLYANNTGSNHGIHATASEGRAASFANKSATNATLYVNNSGDSLAAQLYNTSAAHPTLYAKNYEDYMAAEFVNSSTTHPTLFVSNDGDATGIQATTKAGHAASFTNNSTTNATLSAVNNGSSHGIYAAASEGRAASFTNKSTTNATLLAINNGSSHGIYAAASEGRAASFTNNSATNATLYANNTGSNHGIYATASEGRAASFANKSTTNATLYVNNSGDSLAAQLYNTSAAHPTLYAKNYEDYMAAEFVNSSTTHPTLYLLNSGHGDTLQADGNVTINGSLFIGNINNGSFSLIPMPNKIPVADQSGHINAGWLTAGFGFTTGDTKFTYKNVADDGWMMMKDGTIGNANSSATTRANADTQNLFVLLWNNISNANCPVAGGRGVSALADFDANKTLLLPATNGRVTGITGSGSGLSSRNLADNFGEENHALTADENGPHRHNYNTLSKTMPQSGNTTECWYGAATAVTSISGSGLPHNNMQPTSFLNMMIKL